MRAKGRCGKTLEQRRGAEAGDAFKAIRRGWFYGSPELKQELLAAMSERTGRWHYEEAVQESSVARAERMVRQEMGRRKWDEAALAARRKDDAQKVAMAPRLRRETTVTLAWIAEWLQMGTPTCLAHLLYWNRRNEK
ncbi:MAG: hypothetical protein ABSE16_11735 [Verrucomicrobiota bacterium]